MLNRTKPIIAALVGVLLLSGASLKSCENGLNTDNGALTVSIADAPVDNASQVTIQFSGIEVTNDNGDVQTFNFDPPQQVNLLTLQSGQSQTLLDAAGLPSGQYQSITLKIDAAQGQTDSFVQFNDGSTYTLRLADQSDGNFAVNKSFTIQQGETTNLTVDMQLRASIRQPQGTAPDYVLEPSLRAVDDSEVGRITGTVSSDLIAASGCVPAVYAYSGASVTPSDLNTQAGTIQPISSTDITLDAQSGAYTYTLAFLQNSQYTVAFTCDAAQDDPVAVDALTFIASQNASVQDGQTSTANFP